MASLSNQLRSQLVQYIQSSATNTNNVMNFSPIIAQRLAGYQTTMSSISQTYHDFDSIFSQLNFNNTQQVVEIFKLFSLA